MNSWIALRDTPHPNPSPSRGEGLRNSSLVPPRPLRERGLGGEGFFKKSHALRDQFNTHHVLFLLNGE